MTSRRACREVQLGVAAQWWFEHWMRMYSLPASLKDRISFDSGSFVAWLPTAVPREEAEHFETGGVYHWQPGGCWPRDVLSEFVAEQLRKRDDLVWLFEDPIALPGDAWLAEAQIPNAVKSAERVYYVISRDASAEIVAQTVDIVLGSQPTVGVCAGLDLSTVVERLSTAQLANSIVHIEALTVGAYDGEGFIAWSQASSHMLYPL